MRLFMCFMLLTGMFTISFEHFSADCEKIIGIHFHVPLYKKIKNKNLQIQHEKHESLMKNTKKY